MVKIGDVELRGNLTLGPMAGVTDFAFRGVCHRLGAALTTTEMVSAKALVYHDEKTKELLYIPDDEHPSAAQIFGHEPDVMAKAAENKYFTEKSASIGQSFVCSLERPAELADAVESYNSGFTTVATGNPITAFFFSKGLWGGWLPIFCILVALILDRKRAFWLFPIVLAVLMLVLCPVDDARYVFPMLYCAPLLVGVAASAMMQPAQLHDGRLRHAKN